MCTQLPMEYLSSCGGYREILMCAFYYTTLWNYVEQDDILTIYVIQSSIEVHKCIQPLLHIPGDEAVTDVKQQRQYILTLGSLHSNFRELRNQALALSNVTSEFCESIFCVHGQSSCHVNTTPWTAYVQKAVNWILACKQWSGHLVMSIASSAENSTNR